jgi:hemoglobin/transferrin/lactoferrin receptor protein
VSEGYLYPSLMQLATGAYAGSSFVNPNSELTPETSINYELGWRLMQGPWTVDAALFVTDSSDYIDHIFCTAADPCLSPTDKLYRNIGSSSAHGVELYLAWETANEVLQPYLNVTWMQRNNDFGSFDTWDTGIPALAGRAGIMLEPRFAGLWNSLWADVYLRGESGSLLVEPGARGLVETRRSGWATVNAALGVSLGERLLLAVELQNLFDREYRESTENLLAPGRSASMKLTWNIN